MIQVTDPAECSGCTACASICHKGAISMCPDSLGFLYPKVDMGKCVECGACEKVCPFHENYDTSHNLSIPKTFGARHKIEEEVNRSRSGAAFVALSDYVLENGGIVYGVGYADHFRVCHKRATTKEERDEFRGSKYVQSDLNGIFRSVKKDLLDGNLVLFSGTPCQTAGLNSFIGKKLRSNLILVDIVCHGVPSPFIWRDFLANQEMKLGELVKEVSFRDKKFGWKSHIETLRFDKGEIKSVWFRDMFYKHLIIRKSCGNCYFTNLKRPSDITIADFWGWEKILPEINKDDKGVSLVLCNTKAGISLFEKVAHNLHHFEVDIRDCLQSPLMNPQSLHPKRLLLEKDYEAHGFEYIYLKKYDQKSLIIRLKNKMTRVFKS